VGLGSCVYGVVSSYDPPLVPEDDDAVQFCGSLPRASLLRNKPIHFFTFLSGDQKEVISVTPFCKGTLSFLAQCGAWNW